MREGAATCLGLQCFSEPRSTGFWSATCPLSQAGHCAARGSRAHHRPDQLADWPRSAVRFPIICSNHELSYTLLARARQSFELCSHFKSLPPVSHRELSADLTWRAHRRKPEFPALGLGTQSTRVQGERGVKVPGRVATNESQCIHTQCTFMSCHVMSACLSADVEGARFVRLGLHLIVLWLSCSTTYQLRPAPAL